MRGRTYGLACPGGGIDTGVFCFVDTSVLAKMLDVQANMLFFDPPWYLQDVESSATVSAGTIGDKAQLDPPKIAHSTKTCRLSNISFVQGHGFRC